MQLFNVIRCIMVSSLVGGISGLSALTTTLDNSSILENSELGTVIGYFETPDLPTGETVEYRIVGGDHIKRFAIQGNALVAAYSYDIETYSSYGLQIETISSGGNSIVANFTIAIEDIEGALDTDGIAGEVVAARYPSVNVGDYVIFNSRRGAITVLNGSFPNFGSAAKVLIKGGDYSNITLNGLVGESLENRIPVTNFLGQVKVGEFTMNGGAYWRLTGQYDADKGLGDPHYLGCDSSESGVDFGYSHGRYGIHCSNGWTNETSLLLAVKGEATGFEIDHIEMSDGGFAGIVVKNDNSSTLMENIYLHHLYIHDIGSEGIYLGSTQSDPQHQFKNLLIENCVFLRTGGEALQVGQLMENCVIRNNVMWGAFDWLSPFNRWQDNAIQFYTRAGGATLSNNIVMGGAGSQLSLYQKNKTSLTPNGLPTTISNNLIWGTRSMDAAYIGPETDGTTNYRIEDNFWGATEFTFDKVYPGTSLRSWIRRGGSGYSLELVGNHFDLTRSSYYDGSTVKLTNIDNVQGEVLAPQFKNLIGAPLDTSYLNWTRWTAKIGEASAFPSSGTNKGAPVRFEPGEVVQYHLGSETAFYECLQTAESKEPTGLEDDVYWKRLTWEHEGKVYYRPPDDVRMIEGSIYYDLGIGLADDSSIGDGGVTLEDYGAFSPDPTRYATTIEEYNNSDEQNPPPENGIVVIGSSSIKGWHYRIQSDLEGLTVIPRGFGGSHMSDAIFYAKDIVTRYNPRAVILYEGDNDVQSGKSTETIFNDFKFFVDLCRTTLPELRIYFISIKPSISRWSIWDQMQAANTLISNYCDTDPNSTYIDVASAFLENGSPKTNIFQSDNLHLNDAGYDLWSEVCADVIIPAEIGYEANSGTHDWGYAKSDRSIQIDFGGTAGTANPMGWNTITDPRAVGMPLPLVDANDALTSAQFMITSKFNGTNSAGYSSGADSMLGTFISEATVDSFFGNSSEFLDDTSPNPSIQLTNLYPNAEYDIILYASRMNVTDNRSAVYSITGDLQTNKVYDPGNNTQEMLSFSSIRPDINGTISISITKADTNNNGYGFIYLGALIIEPLADQISDKKWGGYTVDSDNMVNTGSWLGWLKIYDDSGWVYVYSLSEYHYFPEPSAAGGWAYVPRRLGI